MARTGLGRYSRLVRVLRVGLPLTALGMLSSVFLFQHDDFAGGLRFSAADLAQLSAGLRLNQPRFTGVTEAGEPYVVSAEWALPDRPDPTEISLHALAAGITMADGRDLAITAAEGTFFPRAQRVALSGQVVMTSSDGYRAEAAAAEADMKARSVRVPGPLTAEGPLGRIEAGSMTATRADVAAGQRPGDHILFENRVRVLYKPGAERK